MSMPATDVPRLEALYIYATNACNLSCRHCWLGGMPSHSTGALSLEKCMAIVEQAVPLGLQTIKLTGGEPLLVPWIKEGLRLLSGFASLVLETNATLLTPKIASIIADTCTLGSVSIDGSGPRTHDWMRGVRGAYRLATAGIRLLLEAGASVKLVFTIHAGNRDDLPDFIRVSRQMGIREIQVNPVVPWGRARDNDLAYTRPDWLLELVEAVPKWEAAYDTFVDLQVPMAFLPLSRLGRAGTCRFRNLLCVLPDGELALCGMAQRDPGLVLNNPVDLADTWRSSPLLTEVRKMLTSLAGICGKCVFNDVCQGSCRARAYESSGSFAEPDLLCTLLSQAGLFPESRLLNPDLRSHDEVTR